MLRSIIKAPMDEAQTFVLDFRYCDKGRTLLLTHSHTHIHTRTSIVDREREIKKEKFVEYILKL